MHSHTQVHTTKATLAFSFSYAYLASLNAPTVLLCLARVRYTALWWVKEINEGAWLAHHGSTMSQNWDSVSINNVLKAEKRFLLRTRLTWSYTTPHISTHVLPRN